MNYFKRAWRGEVLLWKLFWLVGSAVCVVVIVPGASILPLGVSNPMSPIVIAVQIVTFAIALFWHILVWKNAGNCKWRMWFYTARVLAVIGILIVIASPFLQHQVFSLMKQMGYTAENLTTHRPRAFEPVVVEENQTVFVGSGAPTDTLAIEQRCTQQLRDHATKGGVDADAYLAANQAWVTKCIMTEVQKTNE